MPASKYGDILCSTAILQIQLPCHEKNFTLDLPLVVARLHAVGSISVLSLVFAFFCVPNVASSTLERHTDTWAYMLKACVLRGIRFHDGFATELLDAEEGENSSAFRRALHARAIMSDRVPAVIASDEDMPYCIWYPDTASEATYRKLVRRFPRMRYHVGRACAVAGYSTLYMELDLLPDISIAEEARDSIARNSPGSSGSRAIMDHILAQPVRCHVMDDYTRQSRCCSVGLNDDTAVVSTLSHRRYFDELRWALRVTTDSETGTVTLEPPLSHDWEAAPCYYNITEDWSVDAATTPSTLAPNEALLELLWLPLPHNPPAGSKDLLVLMAAYNGDVDRYARLHRPLPVSRAETFCIRRGIYHSTAFARWWWWSHQQQPQPRLGYFVCAIHARFIMVNDLSRIHESTSPTADTDTGTDYYDLPWQIWYPLLAQPETYLELARRRPGLLYVVARALVVADYQDAWDTLVAQDKIEPYFELLEEARTRSGRNPHYLQSLERICSERNITVGDLESKYSPDEGPFRAEPITTRLCTTPTLDSVFWDQPPLFYNGFGVDAREVELFIAASLSQQMPPGYYELDLARLYYEQQTPSTVPGEESRAYSVRGETAWGEGGRGQGVPYGYGG
ncbi:hypothetical protein SCUCBS95973_003661 [Sporothrix curviconia]|uniref:Uncharacterized protein n=1 Tax=Sporothrix curviconia TaxID=1260050 RepID=A0ABP0BH89_9PEZI